MRGCRRDGGPHVSECEGFHVLTRSDMKELFFFHQVDGSQQQVEEVSQCVVQGSSGSLKIVQFRRGQSQVNTSGCLPS